MMAADSTSLVPKTDGINGETSPHSGRAEKHKQQQRPRNSSNGLDAERCLTMPLEVGA